MPLPAPGPPSTNTTLGLDILPSSEEEVEKKAREAEEPNKTRRTAELGRRLEGPVGGGGLNQGLGSADLASAAPLASLPEDGASAQDEEDKLDEE